MTKASARFRFGIVVFPGSNCDRDTFYVIQDILDQDAVWLWHKNTDLRGVHAVILPGGFSYGDYLRAGAVATHSPIMKSIIDFALSGGLVLGICNGFQILLESGLLQGAMKKNLSLRFVCKKVSLRVERQDTPFTNAYEPNQIITIPIAHAEGNYHPPLNLEQDVQNKTLFTYTENPNGSFADIAGLSNGMGNVLGMMPHPERCSEKKLSGQDGLPLFQSMISYLKNS